MSPRWAKLAAHALCAAPALMLGWRAGSGELGPDPVALLTHETGTWALRILLACLCVTPVRKLMGWPALARYRRMLGLWSFAYGATHLAVYLVLDLGGYWAQIFDDIVKRPFITVGFAALVLMLPLAATSTQGMMRRLGRHWARLHRLVYAVGVLAVLHFWWVVKSGKFIARLEPVIYAALLTVLLLARLPWSRWFRRAPRPA
jgi:sulfoxide reductase heme-binding subunit YedZ